MNAADFHSELEEERFWRQEEVLFLQNRCTDLSKEDKEKYLRALILMVYAHVEGFTRFALLGYVRCINTENMICSEAQTAIAAASLKDVFLALQNPEKKSTLFSSVSDDTALHRFAREREFVGAAVNFFSRKVELPDSVVNTENNLWPVVLKKNLFRLGLPHDLFTEIEGDLSKLVNTRNEIGHGASRRPIQWDLYIQLRDSAMRVMGILQDLLHSAVHTRSYLKS